MTKTKFNLFVVLILFCFNINAQTNAIYKAATIDPSLLIDAHAVVRLEKMEIDIKSIKKKHVSIERVVTLLDSDGLDMVDCFIYYDNSMSIGQLRATMYDRFGKQIKKYTEKKFNDLSTSEGYTVVSDTRLKVLDIHPYRYPVTVKFEVEYDDRTTSFIPRWIPINNYHCAIEKSVYIVRKEHIDKDQVLEHNFDSFSVEVDKSPNQIEYVLSNQGAVDSEYLDHGILKTTPVVEVNLYEFSYKGVAGEAYNFKELGSWYYDHFIKDHYSLEPESVAKVKALIKGITSPEQKARVLYHYLQNHTRYINVLLDKSGYEPMYADQVAKLGYGDCKGLSNYMKALLDVAEVPSYHTLIYYGCGKEMDTTKIAMQGNHMILNIPLEGKDIWLECTSSFLPFGYLSKSIRNKNVMVITPEGGVIKKTTNFPDSINVSSTKVDFLVDSIGGAKVTIERNSSDINYYKASSVEQLVEKEQIHYYKKEWWKADKFHIDEITFSKDTMNFIFTEKLNGYIDNLVVPSGKEALVPLSLFTSFEKNIPKYRHRRNDFKIYNGEVFVVDYCFHMPENYDSKVEEDQTVFENKYGKYKSTLKQTDDRTIVFHREVTLNRGTYKAEEYGDFRDFIAEVNYNDSFSLRIKSLQKL